MPISWAQKENHPIFSKIPDNLWRDEFYVFHKETFKIENIDCNEYKQDKPPIIKRDNFPKKEKQAFILFSVCYPNLEVEAYLKFAQNDLQLAYGDIFDICAALGRLEALKLLVTKSPVEFKSFSISISKSADPLLYPFCYAASDGHLDILKFIEEKLPINYPTYYNAFRAASNGHLHILKWIAEKVPEHLNCMIEGNSFESFINPSKNGHLAILDWIAEKVADNLYEINRKCHFRAFREASRNGHLNILKWFAEKDPNQLSSMIAIDEFQAFRNAHGNGHLDTLNWLLQDRKCLAYAEEHAKEYDDVVIHFIQGKLQSLHQVQEAANPNAVFNLNDAEAKYYYQILKNLIRRNDSALVDDIRFLLDIPAIKALVQQPDESEELSNGEIKNFAFDHFTSLLSNYVDDLCEEKAPELKVHYEDKPSPSSSYTPRMYRPAVNQPGNEKKSANFEPIPKTPSLGSESNDDS